MPLKVCRTSGGHRKHFFPLEKKNCNPPWSEEEFDCAKCWSNREVHSSLVLSFLFITRALVMSVYECWYIWSVLSEWKSKESYLCLRFLEHNTGLKGDIKELSIPFCITQAFFFFLMSAGNSISCCLRYKNCSMKPFETDLILSMWRSKKKLKKYPSL